jgi:alkylation response protein AidB-like acyl-CoA dehydrogenase
MLPRIPSSASRCLIIWRCGRRSHNAVRDVPDAPRWLNRVLSSRQYTIAGGTSEIQRNIIGERQLGLPQG